MRKFPATHTFFRSFFLAWLLSLAGIAHAQTSPGGGPYRLIGTIRGGEVAGAVLADSTGNQVFYRLREKLPDDSYLTAIENETVSVRRADGSRYILYIIHDTKPGQPAMAGAPARADAVPAVAVPASRSAVQAEAVPERAPGPAQPQPGFQPRTGASEDARKHQLDASARNRRNAPVRQKSAVHE